VTSREPPLGLDMPFDEAFERFLGVKPHELNQKLKEGEKDKGEPPKRPPGKKKPAA
jgi:hypothetical protein